jgi:response regulator of citrate/malate metabolism
VIEVLVVDEDVMLARVHSDFVDRTPGFTVTGRAHTATQTLAEGRRLEPDLVLLDVHLPDRSGVDVLAELREAAPEVDVLVTSQTWPRLDERTIPGGMVHQLPKPFSYADLRERLDELRTTYAGMGGKHADDGESDPGVTGAAGLPAGFSAETLKLVGDALLAERSDLSAAEVARLLALSRVSARRYLEHLVETGEAAATTRYGDLGRAERRYRRR